MNNDSQAFSNPYTNTATNVESNTLATTSTGTLHTGAASTGLERPASERVEEAKNYREGKKTGKQLIGMPIISLSDGAEVGTVHDVIYNPGQGRLIAVTSSVGAGLFGGGRTLLLRTEDMHALGEDAIVVKDSNAVREIDRAAKDFGDEAGIAVLGKRLMTDDGSFLGKIDDVLIDRESRRLTAYEVSGGLWHSLMRGQTDVPVEHITSIGADVVIVPASVKTMVHEVTGGLIGTAQVAGEKAAAVKDSAAEKIADARTAAAERIEDKEIDYSIGKVAGSDVTTDSGTTIVRTGETITESHVQQALAANKIHALALAAGKAHAADLYDSAKEKAAAGVDSLKDKQGEMLVGKTVGRDVTFTDGGLLIANGSTIEETHVSAAKQAGKLGDLTAAVAADRVNAAKEGASAKYDEFKEKREQDAAQQSALQTSQPSSGGTIINAETVIVQAGPGTASIVPDPALGSSTGGSTGVSTTSTTPDAGTFSDPNRPL